MYEIDSVSTLQRYCELKKMTIEIIFHIQDTRLLSINF